MKILFSAALLATGSAVASETAHADPVSSVVLALAVILVSAKVGGELAVRLKQPAVLGELVAGLVLGNLGLFGVHALEPWKADPLLDILSRLGVVVLLFEVGLESTVKQMLAVGATSMLVATLGVIAPFALGWLVGLWLVPEAGPYVHAFLGAALTATSVGITARVLQDLGRSRTPEARIILGAAVIDDVLGLVVLAVVSGVIAASATGHQMSALSVGAIVLKSAVFLAGSLWLGVWISPRLFRVASKLAVRGALLAVGLSLCFALAWLAAAIGLAPIVGAFAAGLILEDVHYRDFVDRGEHGLEDLIRPISAFLSPVFFVLMGMRTDLAAFGNAGVLGLAAALIAAAILGKQVCGLGVGRGVDRLTVGLGMIPRGEVGLIFANMGLSLTIHGKAVLDRATYSAIVLVVIVTTLVTPPALRWSVTRRRAAAVEPDRGMAPRA